MAKPENVMKVAQAMMQAQRRGRSFSRGVDPKTVMVTAPHNFQQKGVWEAPQADVIATPEDDAAAINLAGRMNTKQGQMEKTMSQHRDGTVVVKPSLDDSKSHCEVGDGIAFCLHSHPALGIVDEDERRLEFGHGDNAPLLRGTPNYMLNHKRDLFVLEYERGSGGYRKRFIGNVPLGGK